MIDPNRNANTLIIGKLDAWHSLEYDFGENSWSWKKVPERYGDDPADPAAGAVLCIDTQSAYLGISGDRLGGKSAPNTAFFFSREIKTKGLTKAEIKAHGRELWNEAKKFRDVFYPDAKMVGAVHRDAGKIHLHFQVGSNRRISLKELDKRMRVPRAWGSKFKAVRNDISDPRVDKLRVLAEHIERGETFDSLAAKGLVELRIYRKDGVTPLARPSVKFDKEFFRLDTMAEVAAEVGIPALADPLRLYVGKKREAEPVDLLMPVAPQPHPAVEAEVEQKQPESKVPPVPVPPAFEAPAPDKTDKVKVEAEEEVDDDGGEAEPEKEKEKAETPEPPEEPKKARSWRDTTNYAEELRQRIAAKVKAPLTPEQRRASVVAGHLVFRQLSILINMYR